MGQVSFLGALLLRFVQNQQVKARTEFGQRFVVIQENHVKHLRYLVGHFGRHGWMKPFALCLDHSCSVREEEIAAFTGHCAIAPERGLTIASVLGLRGCGTL